MTRLFSNKYYSSLLLYLVRKTPFLLIGKPWNAPHTSSAAPHLPNDTSTEQMQYVCC